MKKLSILLALVGFALGAWPTMAAPVADLAALADYFPDETSLFMGFRTDDDFIDEMDGFLLAFQDSTAIAGPPLSIRDVLDLFALSSGRFAGFDSEIRPWLGDVGAAGVLPLDSSGGNVLSQLPPVLLILRINDQDAAEEFVLDTLDYNRTKFRVDTTDENLRLTMENGELTLLVREDVLVIGSTDAVAVIDDGEPLSDDETFAASASQLPADDYSALMYMAEGGYEAVMDAISLMSGVANTVPVVPTSGTQAFMLGMTFNDQGMFFDIAELLEDELPDARLPLVTMLEAGSVNAEFTQQVPSDALFVFEGHDLNATLQASIATDPEVESNYYTFALGFSFLTGLNFEDDVIGWMTGDFMFFMSPDPDALPTSTLPFDLGLVVEVTDVEAAQALIAGVTDAMASADTAFEIETINSIDVVAIPSTGPDMPDILLGMTDDLFVVGTRRAVTHMLNPPRLVSWLVRGLDVAVERGDLLEESGLILYIDVEGLRPYTRLIAQAMAMNVRDIQPVMDAAANISLSFRLADDAVVYRLAWRF